MHKSRNWDLPTWKRVAVVLNWLKKEWSPSLTAVAPRFVHLKVHNFLLLFHFSFYVETTSSTSEEAQEDQPIQRILLMHV